MYEAISTTPVASGGAGKEICQSPSYTTMMWSAVNSGSGERPDTSHHLLDTGSVPVNLVR